MSEDETFAMLGVDGSGGIGIDIKIGKLEGSGTFNFLTQYQVISWIGLILDQIAVPLKPFFWVNPIFEFQYLKGNI